MNQNEIAKKLGFEALPIAACDDDFLTKQVMYGQPRIRCPALWESRRHVWLSCDRVLAIEAEPCWMRDGPLSFTHRWWDLRIRRERVRTSEENEKWASCALESLFPSIDGESAKNIDRHRRRTFASFKKIGLAVAWIRRELEGKTREAVRVHSGALDLELWWKWIRIEARCFANDSCVPFWRSHDEIH